MRSSRNRERAFSRRAGAENDCEIAGGSGWEPAGGDRAFVTPAALAAPALPPREHARDRDHQPDRGVKPPDTQGRVRQQADQHAYRQPAAQQVLLALTLARNRPEPVADPLLGDPEAGQIASVPIVSAIPTMLVSARCSAISTWIDSSAT
jgi:hypothetical protein